jgi:hypothetical protein
MRCAEINADSDAALVRIGGLAGFGYLEERHVLGVEGLRSPESLGH